MVSPVPPPGTRESLGRTAAAAFAATSLRLGWVVLTGVLLALCAVLSAALREPRAQ